MNYKQQRTAVLYFTRSADEEAHAKTFSSSGNYAQNRAIAQKLIDYSYAQVEASGLPVKIFTSEKQKGTTFGEKLSNAFQVLFDEGFENVIAVGNDCIQLSSEMIRYSADLLQENSVVAGPAVDGGTYLLGISRDAFHKKAFSELAWKTDILYDDFIRYAETQGFEVNTLAVASDIDDEDSLRRLIKQMHGSASHFRLIMLLMSILSSVVNRFQKREISFISHHSRLSLYYRGPPLS